MLSPKTKMLLFKTAALSPDLSEGSGPVCLQAPPASSSSVDNFIVIVTSSNEEHLHVKGPVFIDI